MNKNLELFLMSSFFGDIKIDNPREVCVNKAYLDLSRRIPYKYSVEKLEEMDDAEKRRSFINKKEDFKETIVGIIKSVNESDSPDSLIKRVIEVSKSEKCVGLFKEPYFTYGLAQKWINMTLKYLWLLDECPIDKEKLHAPIDSYIIHAITDKKEQNRYGFALSIDGLRSDLKWSYQIDEILYDYIQKKLGEEVGKKGFNSVVEWENLAWIEQSKIENR